MRLLTVLDPGYPENLRTVHDRPPLVFVAGELTPEDARSIAVVGARKSSPQGRATATADRRASRGTRLHGRLGSGPRDRHRRPHGGARHRRPDGRRDRHGAKARLPARERRAAAARSSREGAVVSQFWPDAPPSRRTFPMRNAVMSGLSLASVVVEASHTSGSRMQARLALEHGRPVFLRARAARSGLGAGARDAARATHVSPHPNRSPRASSG